MIEVKYKNTSKMPREEKLVKKIVENVLKEENINVLYEVYILFTNNDRIQEINREHRQIDKPTDVLSFPMYDKEEIDGYRKIDKEENSKEVHPIILGDIIISVEKVAEQANEYGHTYDRELAYLVVHGMLHILGYDHINANDKKKMRQKEEEILQKLNILRK